MAVLTKTNNTTTFHGGAAPALFAHSTDCHSYRLTVKNPERPVTSILRSTHHHPSFPVPSVPFRFASDNLPPLSSHHNTPDSSTPHLSLSFSLKTMFKFLKGVVAGSASGPNNLPYNIGDPYPSAWGSWTHHRGTSKVNPTLSPLSMHIYTSMYVSTSFSFWCHSYLPR